MQEKHAVLKRMRDTLKKFNETLPHKTRVDLETDLLNDYNYLIAKLKQDNKKAVEGIRSRSSSPFTNASDDILSAITGQSD